MKTKSYKRTMAISAFVIILLFIIGISSGIAIFNKPAFYKHIDADFPDRQGVVESLRDTVEDNVISREALLEYLEGRQIIFEVNPNIPTTARIELREPNIFVVSRGNILSSNLRQHEIYHIALLATGIEPKDHHPTMRENGWCFNACPVDIELRIP